MQRLPKNAVLEKNKFAIRLFVNVCYNSANLHHDNCQHALADRPHTSLWLAKTYVVPAGMYGSQVWGTGFLQAGREFSSPLSTLYLHFSEGHVRCEAVYH